MSGLLTGLLAFEAIMLTAVTRWIRREIEPPAWTWVVNVIVEVAAPSVALLVLTNSEFMGPYRALVAPALLSYFFFIILSTLRLSPLLSLLTGVFAAGGYLLVVAYTFRRFPDPPPGAGALTTADYVTHGLFLLFGGVIAAGVARRIHEHVAAALREADARRQVERMEADLDIARTIQQGLLPQQPPQIDGFDIAGWSRSADATGGDYYDWQTLPDGKAAISLADVTGHGIGPALVMAVCRAYARASLASGEVLGRVFDRVNDLLMEDLPGDRFVTIVVAILDPRAARVQLLSAGHGPLFVYTAGEDRVHGYGAHGIPFGLTAGTSYGPPQDVELAPGDMIVLPTDGFFEWANPRGELFGTKRLADCIRANRDRPAAELIEALHRAVVAFSEGTPQADDLTVVVIKRSPGGDA
jgi:serine phosphatase RsbU (regulator of sigma subunit)